MNHLTSIDALTVGSAPISRSALAADNTAQTRHPTLIRSDDSVPNPFELVQSSHCQQGD
ncbi:secreted protein [Rhodopirellula sallentina SM41]|uniref:Secreted protein n=1 Tax=Rhodopirellula sallentina SM41 TaxID=1263870 RepID=M5UIV9_9BACT|nr:secreted protein [Rhodopirellula sallentina SM41]